MTTPPVPSEETLIDNLNKLWQFLGALSRRPSILALLRAEGLIDEVLQQGWGYALKANGYREAPPAPKPPSDPLAEERARAIVEIDKADEPLFNRLTVVLQGDFPEQLAYLLRG